MLRFDEELGEGGMGRVFAATHLPSGRPLAVKVIDAELARRAEFRDAFRNEASAVARLSHPHVVAVYDYGEVPASVHHEPFGLLEAGSPYLVMEPLRGGSLAERGPAESWRELSDLLTKILSALAHCHAHGILHRDLSPSNVLFAGPDDLRPGLRLIDFGLAALKADDRLEASTVGGTFGYLAPEQIRRRHGLREGPWTDLYSVGCIAFRLATGHGPFDDAKGPFEALEAPFRDALPAFVPRCEVPPGFLEWVRRCTRTDSNARYAHAADAAVDLLALHPSTTISVAPWTRAVPVRLRSIPKNTGTGLFPLRRAPLVGRVEERRALLSAFDEARRERRNGVVVLSGVAGVGKSRLAEWLCVRTAEFGEAAWMRGSHAQRQPPGDGLARMLARHLDCAGQDRIETRRRLEHFMKQCGHADAFAWYGLAELVVNATGSLDRDLDGDTFGSDERHLDLLVEVLSCFAATRPLILWLDDVHWDPYAMRLAMRLAGLPAIEGSYPVLVVCTVRAEMLEEPATAEAVAPLLASDAGLHLEIPPLPEEDMAELVGELLGFDLEVASTLVARAAGMPMFATELVGDWLQRGLLRPGPHGLTLATATAPALPDSLYQLWSERVTGFLDAHFGKPVGFRLAAEKALELAAAMGSDVITREWLAACTIAGIEPPQRLLAHLQHDLLLVRSPSSFQFSHPMLRETLERRARDSGRWPRHNAACAAMIELELDTRRGPVAERLGRHLLEACEHRSALHPLATAARYRLGRGELDLADALIDQYDAATRAIPPAKRQSGGHLSIEGLRGALTRERDAARTGSQEHPVVPLHILLVEDNPGDVRLTQIHLDNTGVPYELHAARDGETGLEFLHKRGLYAGSPTPHLVFLDLRLPRMQGVDVLRAIRRDEHLAATPVVVLTSSDAPMDVLATHSLQADRYLTKPLSEVAVMGILRSLGLVAPGGAGPAGTALATTAPAGE